MEIDTVWNSVCKYRPAGGERRHVYMVTGSVSSKDNTAAFKDLMKIIRKTKVLVGITEETSTREHSGSINNAELLFIHSNGVRAPSMRTDMQPDLDAGKKYSKAYALYIQSHGSPLWQSPPRPVLEPSIEANKEKISAKLKTAYKAVLSGGSDYRDKYEAAGLFARIKPGIVRRLPQWMGTECSQDHRKKRQ